jgi:hypothetical protein
MFCIHHTLIAPRLMRMIRWENETSNSCALEILVQVQTAIFISITAKSVLGDEEAMT